MKKEKNKRRKERFLEEIEIKFGSKDDNIYPNKMSDKEFREIITKYILGENYYIADPLSQGQANTIMACDIIRRGETL